MIYKFGESAVFFLGPILIQTVLYAIICRRLFVGTKVRGSVAQGVERRAVKPATRVRTSLPPLRGVLSRSKFNGKHNSTSRPKTVSQKEMFATMQAKWDRQVRCK